MADTAQTPEAVAHQLMNLIISNENGAEKGRAYILSTYAECLRATTGGYGKTAERRQQPRPASAPKEAPANELFPPSPQTTAAAYNGKLDGQAA